jgi:hypothetical protein
MRRRTKYSASVTMGLLTALSIAVPAHAGVSPQGCGGNLANFDVQRTPVGPTYRLGDSVTFVISGQNTKAGACDIIMTSPLNFNLPNNRGVPSGPATTFLNSGDTFRSGASLTTTSVPWVVAADPDVQFAQAALAGDSDVQDAPAPQHDFFRIARSVSITITHPSMALTKVANPVQGLAPLPVTYTYALTNTGDADIGNINLSDAGAGACSPLTYQSGDLNKDSVLQAQVKNGAGVVTTPAETWTYTCQRVFPVAGVFPNVATATGTSKVDNRPVNPVQANASVTVTTPQAFVPPPAVPPATPVVAPAVNPAVANTCIESPKSLSLRAKELTTVRVTLNSKTKGVKVKVKGPGFTKTLKTNAKGQATFRVRPTRAGTLKITSTNCAKVTKAAVKAARKTVSKRVPQVTG